jgi:hypothetical protein
MDDNKRHNFETERGSVKFQTHFSQFRFVIDGRVRKTTFLEYCVSVYENKRRHAAQKLRGILPSILHCHISFVFEKKIIMITRTHKSVYANLFVCFRYNSCNKIPVVTVKEEKISLHWPIQTVSKFEKNRGASLCRFCGLCYPRVCSETPFETSPFCQVFTQSSLFYSNFK